MDGLDAPQLCKCGNYIAVILAEQHFFNPHLILNTVKKKRYLNYKCTFLLASIIFMYWLSFVFNIHPITVARKREVMAA